MGGHEEEGEVKNVGMAAADAIVSAFGAGAAGAVKKFAMPPPNSQPQRQFFEASTRYVAYGGARGGGKTWAARRKAELLAFEHEGIKILILRRTFPQLQKNFISEMQSELFGLAKYNDSKKQWTFANNSRIDFGYCSTEQDADKYQGSEYDVIFMDEATHFSERQFKKIDACIRGANNYPKCFYLTCNPGGTGHAWVKRLFICRQYRPNEDKRDYTFIPARVQHNTSLMEKNPDYVKRLMALPPELRRAWLDGDWDVFAGQYFSEWRREVHVVPPFAPPQHWKRYFALDYGLDMLAGYAIALDEDGFATVYSEVYEGRENGCGENGGGLLVSQAAQRIYEATKNQKIEAFFAPPDLWNRRQDTGRSVAEVFAAHGVGLAKVSNNRVQGWLDLREWLKHKTDRHGNRRPGITVMQHCENLIESLPALVHSKTKPNDCANEPHQYTHAPDALRYFVAGRPFAGAAVQRGEGGQGEYDDFLEFGVF